MDDLQEEKILQCIDNSYLIQSKKEELKFIFNDLLREVKAYRKGKKGIEESAKGITEQHIMEQTDMEKLRKLSVLLCGGLRIWKKRCEDAETNTIKIDEVVMTDGVNKCRTGIIKGLMLQPISIENEEELIKKYGVKPE